MAYSESLARRVRHLVGKQRGVTEKKLFGGIGFLVNGNLLGGVLKDMLFVRLGVEEAEKAMEEEFVRDFDFTGKSMKGWVVVEPDGLDTDRQLADWVERAMQFVMTLPKKKPK